MYPSQEGIVIFLLGLEVMTKGLVYGINLKIMLSAESLVFKPSSGGLF